MFFGLYNKKWPSKTTQHYFENKNSLLHRHQQLLCWRLLVVWWGKRNTKWVECSPIDRETWVQSQLETYQRLLKWYLISPCLTLSNIRHVSRVKWSNPGKGGAPSPTPRCSSNWKGSLLVAFDYGLQLYLLGYLSFIPSFCFWMRKWIKDAMYRVDSYVSVVAPERVTNENANTDVR